MQQQPVGSVATGSVLIFDKLLFSMFFIT